MLYNPPKLLLLLAMLLSGIWSTNLYAQTGTGSISLEQAMQLMLSNSDAIKQAHKGVEIAVIQKQRLNSAWFPNITATGLSATSGLLLKLSSPD